MTEPLSVSEFNDRITMLVTSSDVVRNIEMAGEISELKRASSGHIYLTLKDQRSTVKCTLFRFAASRLKFEPKVGMKVTVFGSASYYAPSGSLSFNIEGMTPYGKGELQEALEKLKLKLLSEGLFDPERKREVPKYPKTIGVVTSPTGAVIKDIIDTTARRFPVNILLAPATVQGEGAPQSIVAGLKLLQTQDVDVIIVGRGGGSADDLSAFNDESVVRAVCASKVPVISAVGHATDKSLTDLAADKYAETPTAAAMIATPDKIDESRNISNLWQRMNSSLEQTLKRMDARFRALDIRLSPRNAKDTVEVYSGKLNSISMRADMSIERKITLFKQRFTKCEGFLDPKRLSDRVNGYEYELDSLSDKMNSLITRQMDRRSSTLDNMSAMLDSLDPNKVLDRGYSFITDSQGNVIKSVSGMKTGDNITIKMKDGKAVAEVKESRLNE